MRTLFAFATVVAICAWTACSGGGSNSGSGGFGTTTLTSIQVSPNSSAIGAGSQQQFHATANFSDGSTQDVTSSAIWSSSDANIASVDAGGLATGSTSGTVTINAQSGSVNSSAT